MKYLDVRSPSEYRKGHIPGALSLPLFDDDERAEIGTCYKQVGKQEAVALGLEKVATKAEKFLDKSQRGKIYCWRGGMRSMAAFHFFRASGIEADTFPGGYKAYRRWVFETLHYPYTFEILSGKTGSGKTEALRALNKPLIDLEALASHRGSSFGALDTPQPTQEHFENLLAERLSKLQGSSIWIEDESRMIGYLKIPDPIWKQMHEGRFWVLDCPIEERVERLIQQYGKLPKIKLIEATKRLEKKLGKERTALATCAIQNGDYSRAVREILPYYDKAYEKSIRYPLYTFLASPPYSGNPPS